MANPQKGSRASTVTDDDDTNEGRIHVINTLLKLRICRAQYRFRISGVNPQSSWQFGRTPRCKSCEDSAHEGPSFDVSRGAFDWVRRHAIRRQRGRAGRIACCARFRSQQPRIVWTPTDDSEDGLRTSCAPTAAQPSQRRSRRLPGARLQSLSPTCGLDLRSVRHPAERRGARCRAGTGLAFLRRAVGPQSPKARAWA